MSMCLLCVACMKEKWMECMKWIIEMHDDMQWKKWNEMNQRLNEMEMKWMIEMKWKKWKWMNEINELM